MDFLPGSAGPEAESIVFIGKVLGGGVGYFMARVNLFQRPL